MVEQEQALLDLKRQGSQCAEEVKAAEQALQVTRELLQRQRLARSCRKNCDSCSRPRSWSGWHNAWTTWQGSASSANETSTG